MFIGWVGCLVKRLNGGFVVHHNSKLSLLVEDKSKQHVNPLLMELKGSVLGKLNESFS